MQNDRETQPFDSEDSLSQERVADELRRLTEMHTHMTSDAPRQSSEEGAAAPIPNTISQDSLFELQIRPNHPLSPLLVYKTNCLGNEVPPTVPVEQSGQRKIIEQGFRFFFFLSLHATAVMLQPDAGCSLFF